MNESSFQVRFWGVRGSHAAPGSRTEHYGGNTTCVEVQAGGHQIIVDAGTGIIHLGQEMVRNNGDKPIVATILFTHGHHDHTQGFLFFAPSYRGSTTLYIHGPMAFQQTLEESMAGSMMPPFSPVALHELPSRLSIRNISERDYLLFQEGTREPRLDDQFHPTLTQGSNDVRVDVHRSYAHPKGGVLVFRISHADRSLVFATDVEGYSGGDRRLINFARGADYLIHDSQYEIEEYLSPSKTTQGWGHSTWEMATDVARQAGVSNLILTHHDPFHDDRQIEAIEVKARARFPRSTAAREGMVIDLVSRKICSQ
ncbi:MAG: MBL fold metallo-hydrolase [Acidobacteria bacterium]|nr:MBL fold metallo-hydrolase [Acidobacteriota bacterium]